MIIDYRYFAPFGPITYVKIPLGKGCGFVSFVHRQSAEQAISQLNGSIIGGNRVRLSWGRNNTSASTSPTLPSISTSSATWKQGPGLLYSSSPVSTHSPDKISQEKQFNSNNTFLSSVFIGNRSLFGMEGNSVNEHENVWKADTSFEPITRPSSAFSVTSPFSHASVSGQLRTMSGLPSPASSSLVRFASAPNSPEASSRTTPTPTPSSAFSVPSFFE